MLQALSLKYQEILTYYAPLILSILSLLGSCLLIISFIKFPRLRINLGKLIIFITIIEGNISWMIIFSLFYSDTIKNIPIYRSIIIFADKDIICQIFGSFFTFCLWNYFFFYFFICHNLRISFLSNFDNFKQRFLYFL